MVPPAGSINCVIGPSRNAEPERRPVGELAEPASAELGAGGSGRPVGEPSPQRVAKTIVARDSPTTTQRPSCTRYPAIASGETRPHWPKPRLVGGPSDAGLD